MSAQKIVPFLWFDDQAEQAARFYVSTFTEGKIGSVTRYVPSNAEAAGRQSGSVMTVEFQLWNLAFVALNGGPQSAFTPALSFFVTCGDVTTAEGLYRRLAEGGRELMPFQRYPFSDGYGWTEDRFGVSWQVATLDTQEGIEPCLLFTGPQCGRAQQAIGQYAGLFDAAGVDMAVLYGEDEIPNQPGTLKQGRFNLAGQSFRAMDSALDHSFGFSEAISFQVLCDSQREINHYWDGLSEGGDRQAQQCGWLKDRFGISWQVIPRALPAMLQQGSAAQVDAVTRAFLSMRKLDLASLEQAYDGA